MAELPLAIVGVALAWKGVLDFGKLLTELVNDDAREREVLVLGLQCSQIQLQDWGDHWEIDRDNGRFHTFEPSRKEMISKIIFKLEESRSAAMKTLQTKYGLIGDNEEPQEEGGSHRLLTSITKTIGHLKKGRLKARWLMFDRSVLQILLDETTHWHKMLNVLTFLSPGSLVANASNTHSQALESRLLALEKQVEQFNASGQLKSHARGRQLSSNGEAIDTRTLASFAASSIPFTNQVELVQGQIDRSFERHADTRIAEHVGEWWNEDTSSFLFLEVPDEADDHSSTTVCTILYSIVNCHRLIYIFEPETGLRPAVQFCDMLRTLVQGLLSIRGQRPSEASSISIEAGFIDNLQRGQGETANEVALMNVFHRLLREVMQELDGRLAIIINGLEALDLYTLGQESQQFSKFMSGLEATRCNYIDKSKGELKVLFGHKGHATSLYELDNIMQIVDLTDRAIRTACVREDLAVILKDI